MEFKAWTLELLKACQDWGMWREQKDQQRNATVGGTDLNDHIHVDMSDRWQHGRGFVYTPLIFHQMTLLCFPLSFSAHQILILGLSASRSSSRPRNSVRRKHVCLLIGCSMTCRVF